MPNEIAQLYEELNASLERPVVDIRRDGRPVLIYGAGGVGKDVYRVLTRLGMSVLGFLDQAGQPGASWRGIPISRPDDPSISQDRRGSARVIVAIHNKYVEMPPIFENLRRLGYSEVMSFLDLHDSFPDEFGDRFWLTRRTFYLAAETACQAADQLWADETSRSLFRNLLRFRFKKDYGILGKSDTAHQYFDSTVCQWVAPLRFVDCGAYDGDTLAQVIGSGLPLEAILAFEPDASNFKKLSRFVVQQRQQLPKETLLWPCGVDADTRQVRFSGGTGTSGHVDEHGETVIQCAAIDQVAPTFGPNLIKMDIEGAELDALWGAQQTIERYRPGLAICVYHRPEHIWQVPLLVQSWYGTTAKYFLRSYSHNGFETVFYAVPE